MKISIIVAMQKELKLMLPLIKNIKEETREGRHYFLGEAFGHEISVIECGIGKVNASLTTDFIIRCFNPDLVINSGVAGGCDKDMKPLDVLVATAVAYHDVWCGPGTEWGAAFGCDSIMECYDKVVEKAKELPANGKLKFGLICSGDIFISKVEEVAFIKTKFPQALGVDMESGAVAQVCTLHNVPFGVVRVISDTPGEADNILQYQNFWEDAPKATFNLLTEIIEKL